MEELKIYDIDREVLDGGKYAIISTSKGEIIIELFGDSAPQAVMNFIALSKSGFYEGLRFHRVIENFMAQGGCPYSKDNSPRAGTGGPGYRIKCEVDNNPRKHTRGTISMAHAGRDTGGSQFFICFVDCPHLDGEHTTFGAIRKNDSASFAVLDSIKKGDEILSVRIVREIA